MTHVVRDERSQLMARVREQLDTEAQAVRHRHRRRAHPPRRPAGAEQPGGLPAHEDRAPARGAEFRAQGSQRAQEIRARADRDVTVLLADAQSKGEQIRGEGDGERNRIFADAFGRDPEFFSFYRSMQAYEAGLRSNDTRMLLKPDSEFFRFFVDPSGKPREPGASSDTPRRSRTAPAADSEIAVELRHHGSGQASKMAEFIVAIGLVLVIEGLLFAAFPRAAKRLAASAVESPETSLRIAGIVSAVLGIVLIWLVRG